MLHDDATVEHAGGIVFPLNVEGREIVNRRHRRTGRAPDHAPVAGHVEDVDALALEPAGQDELMPEDVFQGRTPFLRHGDEGHVVVRKLEEREILLEDEEMDLVPLNLTDERSHEGEDILGDAGLAALNDAGGKGDLHERTGCWVLVRISRSAPMPEMMRSVA